MGIGRKLVLTAWCVASLGLARVGEQDQAGLEFDELPGSLSELGRQMADVQRYQALLQKPLPSAVIGSVSPAASVAPSVAVASPPDFGLPKVQTTLGTVASVPGGSESVNNPDLSPSLSAIANLDSLAQTASEAKALSKGLPMALAAVVPQAYLSPFGGPQEAKIKPRDAWQKNLGVVEGLQPKGETSFGTAGADQSIFQKAKTSASGIESDKRSFDDQGAQKKEVDSEEQIKAMREKFNAALQQIGELNGENQALGWQEYFKAGDLLADVETLLESVPKDEIDPGAIENLQALYERFGSRDETEGSKRYERVLRHLDPDAIKFREVAPSESVRVIGGASHQNK